VTGRHNRRSIRFMETFRSVFYTPIYVCVAGGFLESEGLDVTFFTCPPQFPHPLSALKHGAADIVQSGIMRCIIALDWGAEAVPSHFAKINARDGFFVLGSQPQEEFHWESLRGARVIPVGFSPMPWASFQWALRKHGIAPEELRLLHGLSLKDAVAAFRQGHADFIHLPEPAVEQLITDGVGHLAVALGPENGHVAYSSFAATTKFMDENPDAIQHFVRGFSRALQWLANRDALEIGKAIAPFFPDVPPDLIAQAVARYQSQNTWPADPSLGQPEYDGLQEILVSAGLVKERQPYEKVVRPIPPSLRPGSGQT
jgi:NitT/TauT family transport system substrate-binding protein